MIVIAIALFFTGCSVKTQSVRLGFAKPSSVAFIRIEPAINEVKKVKPAVKTSLYARGQQAMLDGIIFENIYYLYILENGIVNQRTNKSNIATLTGIDATDNANRIVDRRSHDIEKVHGLNRKTIASPENSAIHHFKHTRFPKYAKPHECGAIQFFTKHELPQQLIQGDVDAVFVREPLVISRKIIHADLNAT